MIECCRCTNLGRIQKSHGWNIHDFTLFNPNDGQTLIIKRYLGICDECVEDLERVKERLYKFAGGDPYKVIEIVLDMMKNTYTHGNEQDRSNLLPNLKRYNDKILEELV
jgi:hypothetical protein